MKLRSTLGYTAAGATVLAAVLVPFQLMGMFSKGVVALGLHVDEVYSGGPVERVIQEGAYSITIHKAVYPHMLQNEKPFVQMDWGPASALPGTVSDLVDIDGDGRPDVRVSFAVPSDAKAALRVDVASLSGRYVAMQNTGKEKNSRLIVRVDNSILVRVPLRNP